MSKQRKNASKIKMPPPRTEERGEFGKAAKGAIACRRCSAVFFEKSWRHSARFIKRFGKKVLIQKAAVCPACAMIANRQHEGEVVIKSPPEAFRKHILELIHAYGKRAMERDPEDRIIAVKKRGEDILVTATENQLAAKLAKKIKETFPPAAVEVIHAVMPSDVARASVIFFRAGMPVRPKRGVPAASPLRRRGNFHYTVRRRVPRRNPATLR